MKAIFICGLLLSAVLTNNVVRYSNSAITEKLYTLRDGASAGAAPNTETISHGTKVKVEFSVE